MLFGFPRHRAFPSRISLRLQLLNAQLFKTIFWSLKSLTCSIQLSAAATRRIRKHRRSFPTRKFFCLLSSAPGSPAAAVISVTAKGFFVMFVAVVAAAGIVATTRSKLSPSHFMNIANQSVYSGTLNRRHWRRKETEASVVAHLGSLVLPVLSATFNYY